MDRPKIWTVTKIMSDLKFRYRSATFIRKAIIRRERNFKTPSYFLGIANCL